MSRPVYRNRKVLEHITHFRVTRVFDVLFIERERSASKFQKLVAPKIAFNTDKVHTIFTIYPFPPGSVIP